MPRLAYKTCRHCGKSSAEVGELSWTRSCPSCSRDRLNENIDGIHTMSGPAAERWRRAMAASVGAVLLDEAPARGHTPA